MTKERFTTPYLRFVQGDTDEAQTKDAAGNLRVVKSGPNAGQPNPQWFVAGAIAKNDPAWPAYWAQVATKAAQDFPAFFPQGAAPIIAAGGPAGPFPQGSLMHPRFSFKIVDGDGLDDNGKSNAAKPGFAGHWVIRFGTGYAPKLFHAGRYSPQDQIQENGVFKRGYFIRVSGTMEGNGDTQRPGMYLNMDMVELSAICPPDQLIVGGPDAGEAFGGAPAGALPPGAQAFTAPAGNAPSPAAPPTNAPAPATTSAPSPAAAPAPSSPPAAPYAGFIPAGNDAPAAAAPSPQPAPATPAAPSAPAVTPSLTSPAAAPARAMLPAAGGATYEAMIAAGWTDETLVAHGMMAA